MDPIGSNPLPFNQEYLKYFDCIPIISWGSAICHIYLIIQEKKNSAASPFSLIGRDICHLKTNEQKEWSHGLRAVLACVPILGNIVLAIYYVKRTAKKENIKKMFFTIYHEGKRAITKENPETGLTKQQRDFLNVPGGFDTWDKDGKHITRITLQKILGICPYGDEKTRDYLDEKGVNAYLDLLQKILLRKGVTKTKFLPAFSDTKSLSVKINRFEDHIFTLEFLNKLNSYNNLILPIEAIFSPSTDKNGGKWILCEIDLQDEKIKFYSSFAKHESQEYIGCVFGEIQQLFIDKTKKGGEIKKFDQFELVINDKADDEFPHHLNASDSGVFVCKFAEKIAFGESIDVKDGDLLAEKMMAKGQVREQITARLMNGSLPN